MHSSIYIPLVRKTLYSILSLNFSYVVGIVFFQVVNNTKLPPAYMKNVYDF